MILDIPNDLSICLVDRIINHGLQVPLDIKDFGGPADLSKAVNDMLNMVHLELLNNIPNNDHGLVLLTDAGLLV